MIRLGDHSVRSFNSDPLSSEQDQLFMSKFPFSLRWTLLMAAVFCASATLAAESSRPPSQVLVEAGWGRPYGELAQDYTQTTLGFGAGDGLELGFRWRYHFSQTLSLSPAFHFMDYRDFKSTSPEIGDYRISSSSLRYTLELMIIQGDDSKSVRPFLAFSGGLYRNRVVGFNKSFTGPFDESTNTLGFGARGGVRLGGFELSAVFSLNRFDSWRYFQTGEEEAYNWDNFSVRAGWIIPFSDGPDD